MIDWHLECDEPAKREMLVCYVPLSSRLARSMAR